MSQVYAFVQLKSYEIERHSGLSLKEYHEMLQKNTKNNFLLLIANNTGELRVCTTPLGV